VSAVSSNLSEVNGGLSAQQERVLDAAQACFVRSGFHRTTMQDIAKEASMSPANIYRYFASKEALVLGWATRQRESATTILAELERSGDRRAALFGIIAHYHVAISRDAAVLRVDLWSESARNPGIAAIWQDLEDESRKWFVDLLASLATSPDCDPDALFMTMNTVMKGLTVNRALLPDHDPAPVVAQLHALIDAGLAGNTPSAPKPARRRGR
jgi:AcrR family transcriptional regulator